MNKKHRLGVPGTYYVESGDLSGVDAELEGVSGAKGIKQRASGEMLAPRVKLKGVG